MLSSVLRKDFFPAEKNCVQLLPPSSHLRDHGRTVAIVDWLAPVPLSSMYIPTFALLRTGGLIQSRGKNS